MKTTKAIPATAVEKLLSMLKPALERDLSFRQVALLLHVSEHPGARLSFGEIGTATTIPSKPAVTRAADRLADEGFLTRAVDGADHRRVLLSLTKSGNALAAKIVAGFGAAA